MYVLGKSYVSNFIQSYEVLMVTGQKYFMRTTFYKYAKRFDVKNVIISCISKCSSWKDTINDLLRPCSSCCPAVYCIWGMQLKMMLFTCRNVL